MAPPRHSIRGDTPGLTPSPSPGVAPVELRGRRDFCHPVIARSPLPPGLSVEATKDMKHRGGNKGLGPPPPAREAAEEVQGRAGTSPHPCVAPTGVTAAESSQNRRFEYHPYSGDMRPRGPGSNRKSLITPSPGSLTLRQSTRPTNTEAEGAATFTSTIPNQPSHIRFRGQL